MNRPSPTELIEEKFDDLPSTVQNMLKSTETVDAVDKISQKYKLSEEQELALIDEIAYVLFSITPIIRFKRQIQESLSLNDEDALAISTEIFGSIFSPVKKFLKDTDEGEDTKAGSGISPSSESLEHHDILREIENPTPSIKINESKEIEIIPDTKTEKPVEKDAKAIEVMPKTLMTADPEAVEKTEAPTLEEAIGAIPNLGGFKPHADVSHPAQKVADKLQQSLSGKTASMPTEVYQTKKPDPYKEPIA